jgi:C_GCAxxG_C_C family probable redox protein
VNPDPEKLIDLIGARAKNLFLTGQLLCTEAVLTVINQGLKGDLPPELAIRIASGLPEGLGGSGCLCGALNGGVLALGLFLGRNRPGFGNGNRVRRSARMLHDCFRETFGGTCCRNLTRDFRHDRDLHFKHCAELTAEAARMTARIILHERPDVVKQADTAFLQQVDATSRARIKKIAGLFRR